MTAQLGIETALITNPELTPPMPTAELHESPIDGLRHVWGTEISDPNVVLEAKRVQAIGYKTAGHVTEGAINPIDGTLLPSVDGATGPAVNYHLATSDGVSGDAALRIAGLMPGQTYHDHPWFKMAGEGVTANGSDRLAAIPPEKLKEVSGFATIKSPEQLYWLLGQVAREADTDDAWVFGIVKETYRALSRTLGTRIFEELGDPVPIAKEHVNSDIEIVPALVEPRKIPENVALSYFDAVQERDLRAANRFLKTLKIISHGATSEERGDIVNAALWHSMRMAAMKPVGRHAVSHVTGVVAETRALSEYPNGVASLVEKTWERKENPGWSEPLRYKVSGQEDFGAVVTGLQSLGESQGIAELEIDDQSEAIARDLFAAKYPQHQQDKSLELAFVTEWLSRGANAGTWVYFPWSHKLVRYADQEDHLLLRTSRNRHLVTLDQQKELYYNKTVAVMGQSVGSEIAIQTIQAAIADKIVLADFDTTSWSNLNRLREGGPAVGTFKIDGVARRISELDPYVQQVHLRDGLTPESLSFLQEHKPDFVFDAMDNLGAKVLLRQAAREAGVPVVMMTDAGEKVVVDIESGAADRRELFNGRVPRTTIAKILRGERPTRGEALNLTVQVAAGGWLRLLKIADEPLLNSLAEQGKTLTGFPQLGSTVATAGSLAVDVMRAAILRQPIDSMPRHRVVDPNKALGLKRVNNGILRKLRILVPLMMATRRA